MEKIIGWGGEEPNTKNFLSFSIFPILLKIWEKLAKHMYFRLYVLDFCKNRDFLHFWPLFYQPPIVPNI